MTAKRFLGSAAMVLSVAAAACSADPPRTGTLRGPGWMAPPSAGTTGAHSAAAGGYADLNGAGPTTSLIMTTGNSGAAGAMLKDGQCARQDISTARIEPTVWLVVDASGSMTDKLGDKRRWDAEREALMDPMVGIVKTLEHNVKFGMIMYDGPLGPGGMMMGGGTAATTCPRIVAVEPKLDNFNDINAMFPMEPLGGSTPTDKAMKEVVNHLPNAAGMQLDTQANPTIVVLATDGAPNDFCSMDTGGGGFFGGGGFGPDVRPAVITAVQQLAAGGNKTYVISLAGDDQMLQQHLNDVAKAGMTGMPPFVPSNKDQLVQAFKNIIGPGVACDIKLNGKVKMGSECKGKLEINGNMLPCNDDNGWKLKDETTISVLGSACEKYKTDRLAMLHADFPCDIFTLN